MGGVIEHVKNLDQVVSELYRTMKISGMAFNTVPCLSLSSLSYRQLWGNIPYLPFLKQVAEFFHIKLMGGKHMKWGYERSFTKNKLKKVFYEAGFNKVDVEFFDSELRLEFLKSRMLKFFLNKLARHKLFWSMVYVSSSK